MNENHFRFQRILREAAQYKILRRILQSVAEETPEPLRVPRDCTSVLNYLDTAATVH